MTRRPATFIQADIARAYRAAQQCAPDAVVELDLERRVIRILPPNIAGIAGKTEQEAVDEHETVDL